MPSVRCCIGDLLWRERMENRVLELVGTHSGKPSANALELGIDPRSPISHSRHPSLEGVLDSFLARPSRLIASPSEWLNESYFITVTLLVAFISRVALSLKHARLCALRF